MQRVRMSLPEFLAAGWEVHVLAADDDDPIPPIEPALLATIPATAHVEAVRPFSRRWTRWFGSNSLGPRLVFPLLLAGCRLLRRHRFDVVYFSTTQFAVLPLGRVWRSLFGAPYVIDLQDPWRSDFYDRPGAPPPPGGWKYGFARAVARLGEAWTFRRAEHVISVSEAYLTKLAQRYHWWARERGSVLPFGAPDADFDAVRNKTLPTRRLLPATSALKIGYAGRLGADMEPALEVLFAALAMCLRHGPAPELYFFGTSYAPTGRGTPTTNSLAERHGVADLVHESPDRIPYLDSLRLLLDSDLALILGSTDLAYSPSKILPVLTAGVPAIAIAPQDSTLARRAASVGGIAITSFSLQTPLAAANSLAELLVGFVREPRRPLTPPPRPEMLADLTAKAGARHQLAVFSAVVAAKRDSASVGTPS